MSEHQDVPVYAFVVDYTPHGAKLFAAYSQQRTTEVKLTDDPWASDAVRAYGQQGLHDLIERCPPLQQYTPILISEPGKAVGDD